MTIYIASSLLFGITLMAGLFTPRNKNAIMRISP